MKIKRPTAGDISDFDGMAYLPIDRYSELFALLQKTVIKMNPATAVYRHSGGLSNRKMDALCNWQLEIEAYLEGEEIEI